MPQRVTARMVLVGRRARPGRMSGGLIQLDLPLEAAAGGSAAMRPAHRADPRTSLAEAAREWANRSTADQGLPMKVSDPLVLRKVAVLLGLEPTPPTTRATPA